MDFDKLVSFFWLLEQTTNKPKNNKYCAILATEPDEKQNPGGAVQFRFRHFSLTSPFSNLAHLLLAGVGVFWRPLDFEGVPKVSCLKKINIKSTSNEKSEVQEGGLKHHNLLIDF